MKTKTTIQQLIEFQRRTKVNWSVISSLVGVNKYTMSRWINGHQEPLEVYQKIILKIIKKSC